MVLRMVGGILTARMVEPAVLGLFNGIGLVLGYLPFLQLGILNGLNRDLPYHFGRNERDRALSLASAAHAVALLAGGATAVVLFLTALWFWVNGDLDHTSGWATYAALGFLFFYSTNYLQITYRTHSDFARLSMVNVVRAIAGMFLVAAVWALGFGGLCIRALFIEVTALLLLWHWRPVKVAPRWRRRDVFRLLKVGAPIFVVGQVYSWWGVLLNTLVLALLGTEGMGLFALAMMVRPALFVLPSALGQITYPRLSELYGREHRVLPLIRYIRRPVLYMLAAMIPISVLAWFLIPPFTRLLLPQYSDGIPAAQWYLIPVSMACFEAANNIFTAVGKLRFYFFSILIGMAVTCVTLLVLVGDGLYLAAFPQALVAGRAVFYLLCWLNLWELVRHEKRQPDTDLKSSQVLPTA